MSQFLTEIDQEAATLPIRILMFGIVNALVDDHQSVTVTATDDQHGTTIALRVASTDLGKIIGKQGRTARSIRIVLQAASVKLGRRFALDIQAAETASLMKDLELSQWNAVLTTHDR